MKNRMAGCLAALVILLSALPGTGLANGWGLSGPILDYVMPKDKYDDYYAIDEYYKRDSDVTAAVMESRYHSVLIVMKKTDGEWKVIAESTTAVWQPGDGKTSTVTCDAEGRIILGDSKNEGEFVFATFPATAELEAYRLGEIDAEYGDGNVLWNTLGYLSLNKFNVRLAPETEADAKRMADWNAYFSDWGNLESIPGDYSLKGDKSKQAVYSAPSKKAWRAAKGKASVDLNGGANAYCTSDGFDLIEYEVSFRTHRFGWIKTGHLGDLHTAEWDDKKVKVITNTILTDDPLVGQYAQFDLSAGTEVTVKTGFAPYWVYCAWTNQKGQNVWGFVSAKALELPEEEIASDVMEALTGTWAGGRGDLYDAFRLDADGTGAIYFFEAESKAAEKFLTVLGEENPPRVIPKKLVTAYMPIQWRVVEGRSEGSYVLIIESSEYTPRYSIDSIDPGNELTLTNGEAGWSYIGMEPLSEEFLAGLPEKE